MSDAQLTIVATALLVLIGFAQFFVLLAQRHQQRLDWAEMYRRRWIELKGDWAIVVFLGRRSTDYYQIAHYETLQRLHDVTNSESLDQSSSWAQASIRNICGLLSDLCSRILQGDLQVRDIYPIFGTELLRQSAPLRILLDGQSDFLRAYGSMGPTDEERKHDRLRSEMTTWLVCHDGMRRRCLIMLDLLWAEAARLEDLPPTDLALAADSKAGTGYMNRLRIRAETRRLNRWWAWLRPWKLSQFLRHAEWQKFSNWHGLNKTRLKKLNDEWTSRYLRS
ncbi:MAG: hypothetical protein RR365_07165 [Bacteroides sp.]